MKSKAVVGIILLALILSGCSSDAALSQLQTQYAVPTYVVVTATPIIGGSGESAGTDSGTPTPDGADTSPGVIPIPIPSPTPISAPVSTEELPGEPPDYEGVAVFKNEMPYHSCMPAIVTGHAFDLRIEAIAAGGYSLEDCPIVEHIGPDGPEEVYFQPGQFIQVWWFNEDKEDRLIACIDELCIHQVAMCGDRGRPQVDFYPDIYATEYIYLREQNNLPDEEDICHYTEAVAGYYHVPGGSRLGSHIIESGHIDQEMVINSQVRSATIVVNEDGHYAFANAFLRARSDRIVLLRSTYFENEINGQQFRTDPERLAEEVWGRIQAEVDHIDPDLRSRIFWQTSNELDAGNSGDWNYARERARWLNRYTIRCAELAEQHGIKIGGYAFGVGQPEIDLLESEYRAAFTRLAAGGHAIVTHDYYGRTPQDGWEGNFPYGWGYFFGRYRTIIDLDIPGLRIIIGETGAEHIDKIPGSDPYRTLGYSSQQYIDQLKQLDQALMMDDEVLFASVFAHGRITDDWAEYDIKGETARLLYQYIDSTYR
ncbi:MAG: hypothetical protein JXJ17_06785 [Anaerolineae bacterium]|nr:hypothetical protein [Anaerolineae bacterium]